jgi:hypothetical protein
MATTASSVFTGRNSQPPDANPARSSDIITEKLINLVNIDALVELKWIRCGTSPNPDIKLSVPIKMTGTHACEHADRLVGDGSQILSPASEALLVDADDPVITKREHVSNKHVGTLDGFSLDEHVRELSLRFIRRYLSRVAEKLL